MKRRLAVTLAVMISLVLALVVIVGIALAASVTITVNPAPPHAIRVGSGTENYNYSLEYQTVPYFYTVHIIRLNSSGVQVALVKCDAYVNTNSSFYPNGSNEPPDNFTIDQDIENTTPGCTTAPGYQRHNVSMAGTSGVTNTITGSDTWSPPAGTPQGIYQVHIDFLSDNNGPFLPEAGGYQTFWIANGVGNLILQKFHDYNANGVWDIPSEPGMNDWELTYALPSTFGGASYATLTADGGVITVTNIPAAIYKLSELLQSDYSQITPTVPIYLASVTDNFTTTVAFGNSNSLMACTSLTNATPLANYIVNDVITYTLSYTKTGTDDGAPVATLYFAPPILARDTDTSGVTPSGLGTLLSPYRWVLPTTSAASGSFDVALHFTSAPTSALVGTTRVINGVAPITVACTKTQNFTPNAVTLSSLQAQPVATSPVLPVALVGGAAAILLGAVLFTRKSRKQSV
jgi:hypothetical protein